MTVAFGNGFHEQKGKTLGGRPTVHRSRGFSLKCSNDQFVKMKDSGGKVCILKGDRVATEEEEVLSFDVPVDMETTSYDLIFPHPEVLVENTNMLKVIKSAFKTK